MKRIGLTTLQMNQHVKGKVIGRDNHVIDEAETSNGNGRRNIFSREEKI